jgi:hypothetical protein
MTEISFLRRSEMVHLPLESNLLIKNLRQSHVKYFFLTAGSRHTNIILSQTLLT